MRPLGIKPAPVAIDGEGMCPVSLDGVLSSWDEEAQGPRPRVVIVVATGACCYSSRTRISATLDD